MADSPCILDVGDAEFEREVVTRSHELPVLVDFWAPWCGPCKAISPMVESLAVEYAEQVKFAKCNVDDNPVTPTNYGIKAIPTLLFFKEGKLAEQVVGMTSKIKLTETIDKLISGEDISPPFQMS